MPDSSQGIYLCSLRFKMSAKKAYEACLHAGCFGRPRLIIAAHTTEQSKHYWRGLTLCQQAPHHQQPSSWIPCVGGRGGTWQVGVQQEFDQIHLLGWLMTRGCSKQAQHSWLLEDQVLHQSSGTKLGHCHLQPPLMTSCRPEAAWPGQRWAVSRPGLEAGCVMSRGKQTALGGERASKGLVVGGRLMSSEPNDGAAAAAPL